MFKNKKGFTIVELVIVIAVIGILAAVLIPTFNGITKKAEESKSLQETRNTLTEFIAENGSADAGMMFYYPVSEKDGTTTYNVYLYANGALNYVGQATANADYSTVGWVQDKEYTAGTVNLTAKTFSFNVTHGSYIFVGTATFDANNDATYGEALIAKESSCSQTTTNTQFTVTIDNKNNDLITVSENTATVNANGDVKFTVANVTNATVTKVEVKVNGTGATVSYDETTKEITVSKVTANVTIEVTAEGTPASQTPPVTTPETTAAPQTPPADPETT